MEWLAQFFFGVGGALAGAFLIAILAGVYFMWRSSRKLGEMS
jgi:hypothetical protein